MCSELTTDVLIVGGGPTGLMAANELLRQGIDFQIIEKRTKPSQQSRALAIQPRTLETLDQMGLVDRFIKQGFPSPGAKLHFEGTPLAKIEWSHLQTHFPYLMVLPQSKTETILENHLVEQGGSVKRKWEFSHLSIRDGYVHVTAIDPNQREKTMIARYLLACDGAHSPVRKDLNIPFSGEGENTTFFLGDVQVNGLDSTYINVFLTERGLAAFFPFKEEHYRVITVDFSKQHFPHQDALSLVELQESVDRIIPHQFELTDPQWLTQFGTAHRQVPSYRYGPVFFLGDAAHIHNPAGGQGMNLGIQDAANLTWKLALVLSGKGHPDILDTFHTERHPIAEATLKGTSRALKALTIKPPWTKVRNWLGRSVLTSQTMQDKILNQISNLAVHYRSTPHAEKGLDPLISSSALCAGDRVPDLIFLNNNHSTIRLFELLRKPRFLCLYYMEELNASHLSEVMDTIHTLESHFKDQLSSFIISKGGTRKLFKDLPAMLFDVHGEVPSKLGMKMGHLLVIRPDGYVAFHLSSWKSEPALEKINLWLKEQATV
ncbi:2-polyprenyl-6-methoxyphenol hydroxylase [Melghirimyces algeriensis]|uniref:2-polyprenyl-6-methoxyphenol hydroxylase n=2 Tax=Melghirimyces algeriensis TaxID=910412 RepID=A0A521ENZ9_9BACL|nr:2-polyprenyl-6-methoxyphenol hydroxylase [Melghirimyces algeriensis]